MHKTILIAALAILLGKSSAFGQMNPQGAPAYDADLFLPFVDPPKFDNDYRLFAPVEIEDLGRLVPPKTGFYGSMSKVLMRLERPEYVTNLGEFNFNRPQDGFLNQSDLPNIIQGSGFNTAEMSRPEGGDWGWGNRFDFGYMTENDHGWSFTAIILDSPNAVDVQRIPQINRINDDDEFIGFLDPNNSGEFFLNLPRQDRNNIFTNQRDFDLHMSLNVAEMSSIEMNKTFRNEPLHSGGYFEPFLGLRYVKFTDFTRMDQYLRLDDEALALIQVADTNAAIEELIVDNSTWTNHMVGGQLGFRYVMPSFSRVTVNAECRVFAFHNYQEFNRTVDVEYIQYDGIGDGSMIDTEERFRVKQGRNYGEFVFGTDVRADAAVALTRDISLTTGLQYMLFAKGIARGNNINHNSEPVGLFGLNLGVVYNR